MNFSLNDDQVSLPQGIRDFCEQEFPVDKLGALEKAPVTRERWKQLAEMGVFSLRLPEAQGGIGLGMAEAVLVFAELGRRLVPGPLVWTHLLAGEISGAASGDAIRDGAVTHGSWTQAGGVAAFVVDTSFPPGSDPVSVHQEGTTDRTAGTRSYARVVTFADEHQETLEVQAQLHTDGTRTLSGTHTRPAGTTTFALAWDPETQVLSGTVHGPQEESGSLTLVRLEDGGALLQFTWNDPSADLTVVGNATIGPDGAGCGEVTVSQHGGSSRYVFCFDAGGRGFIGGSPPVPF